MSLIAYGINIGVTDTCLLKLLRQTLHISQQLAFTLYATKQHRHVTIEVTHTQMMTGTLLWHYLASLSVSCQLLQLHSHGLQLRLACGQLALQSRTTLL